MQLEKNRGVCEFSVKDTLGLKVNQTLEFTVLVKAKGHVSNVAPEKVKVKLKVEMLNS